MLEKLVIVQVDEVDTSALKLKFPPAARSGQSCNSKEIRQGI
jgi:ATP-binding cassette subfamily F protein 3